MFIWNVVETFFSFSCPVFAATVFFSSFPIQKPKCSTLWLFCGSLINIVQRTHACSRYHLFTIIVCIFGFYSVVDSMVWHRRYLDYALRCPEQSNNASYSFFSIIRSNNSHIIQIIFFGGQHIHKNYKKLITVIENNEKWTDCSCKIPTKNWLLTFTRCDVIHQNK